MRGRARADRGHAEHGGLEGKASLPAGVLSHGEKQWLEIGMVMALDPELLLVDEPVAGMTTRRRRGPASCWNRSRRPLGARHRARHGVRATDRRKVTVLHQGTVLCEGPVEQVQSDPACSRSTRRRRETAMLHD